MARRLPPSAPRRYHVAASASSWDSPPRPREYMTARFVMAPALPASAPFRYHFTASASSWASPPLPRSYIQPSAAMAREFPPSASRRYKGAESSSLFMHATRRLYSVWVCAMDACQDPLGSTRSRFTLIAFVRVLQSANFAITHSCSGVRLAPAQPPTTTITRARNSDRLRARGLLASITRPDAGVSGVGSARARGRRRTGRASGDTARSASSSAWPVPGGTADGARGRRGR